MFRKNETKGNKERMLLRMEDDQVLKLLKLHAKLW